MSSPESISWAEHPELVAFYTEHRKDPADLYPSERRFLPWLARQADSVLDVGCAAGGFSNVWKHYQPEIAYQGVDLSPSMIDVAREVHPDLEFLVGNCADGLLLPDRSATVVAALGCLHWEPRYQEAIRELWRLTDRFLFFDLRLVSEPGLVVSGKQQIPFHTTWDGKTTVPYIAVDWPTLSELLVDFRPAQILGYGYWREPAASVLEINQPVCFAAFVLEKPTTGQMVQEVRVCLNVPLKWPEGLKDKVKLFPATDLEALVPPFETSSGVGSQLI